MGGKRWVLVATIGAVLTVLAGMACLGQSAESALRAKAVGRWHCALPDDDRTDFDILVEPETFTWFNPDGTEFATLGWHLDGTDLVIDNGAGDNDWRVLGVEEGADQIERAFFHPTEPLVDVDVVSDDEVTFHEDNPWTETETWTCRRQ